LYYFQQKFYDACGPDGCYVEMYKIELPATTTGGRWNRLTMKSTGIATVVDGPRGPAIKFLSGDVHAMYSYMEPDCSCGDDDAPVVHKHQEPPKPQPVYDGECFTADRTDYLSETPMYVCFYDDRGRSVTPYDCTYLFPEELKCELTGVLGALKYQLDFEPGLLAKAYVLARYLVWGSDMTPEVLRYQYGLDQENYMWLKELLVDEPDEPAYWKTHAKGRMKYVQFKDAR
jgi:hypothetical protein